MFTSNLHPDSLLLGWKSGNYPQLINQHHGCQSDIHQRTSVIHRSKYFLFCPAESAFYSFILMFQRVRLQSGHKDITHPFVGQYVDEEAVSTSQVHERLPGSEALPCTLLVPEHLRE